MSFKQYTEDNTAKFPNGVYISVSLTSESNQNILKYFNEYILPWNKDIIYNTDQHITLIYSEKPLNRYPMIEQYAGEAKFIKFSLFGPDNDILVVEVKAGKLVQRNKKLTAENDFISDFDEYKPHFTISYNAKNVDINNLPPMTFPIIFEQESVENINVDWVN